MEVSGNWKRLPDQPEHNIPDVGKGQLDEVEKEVLEQVAPAKADPKKRAELEARMSAAKERARMKAGRTQEDMPSGATPADFKGDTGFDNEALQESLPKEELKMDEKEMERIKEFIQKRYETMQKQAKAKQEDKYKEDAMHEHPDIPEIPALSDEEDFASVMLKTIEKIQEVRNKPGLTRERRWAMEEHIMMAFASWVSDDEHRALLYKSTLKMALGKKKADQIQATYAKGSGGPDDDDIIYTRHSIKHGQRNPVVLMTNLGKLKVGSKPKKKQV